MKAILSEIEPVVIEIFNHLHEHPEVSWKETETTNYIQSLVEEQYDVTTFEDSTGLVATAGEAGPTVGLRTDIDALWQKVDGVYRANHSCGHDAHMAITLGAMFVLEKLGYPKKGRLKVLFQPAEEKGTGALSFVEKGLVDDVDYLYGLHLRPIQEIGHGYSSAALMHGAGKMLKGEIIGNDAHGARPHLGENAIEVMALLVGAIHGIHIDPMVPYSAKVTMFQAGGESPNIIPGNGIFSIDLRAQTNEAMDLLMKQVDEAIVSIATLKNVQIPYELTAEIAAAEVDETAVRLMEKAIIDTCGEAHLVPPIITPGGEDFHYYSLKRPQVKATMLGLGCDLSPGLHHPNMTFNQDCLIVGVEILVRTVIETFERLEAVE